MGSSEVLDRLNNLQQLYVGGFQNDFLDNVLEKVIEYQVARDEADLQEIERSLAEYERRFGLSSTEFLKRFQAGELDDTADFMEWNVLCTTRQRLTMRLKLLTSEGAHE